MSADLAAPADPTGTTAAESAPDEVEPQLEVGVGPWPGGEAAWPRTEAGEVDPRYDAELLAAGDRRNVVDEFRYLSMETIVAELDTRRHPLHVAIENWGHDLNIGSVVRTANAFAAAEIHIVGRRRWNRRGAMVTDRYQHVRHHPDVAAFLAWAHEARVPVIGIDNVPGSIPIEGYEFPRECALLFGQESIGLTDEARLASADILHITQFGSTRSINAGAAAAIAMHAWVVQHAHV